MPPAWRPPNQFPTNRRAQPPAYFANRFPAFEFSFRILLAYTVKDDSSTRCGSCIMVIVVMRLEKLRQVDLNLLITFAAIAEEKSVTAAASRLLLSQPAVSRALQRARALFQDDLLVRSPNGFELTLRGRRVLDEREGLVPKMETLVAPVAFDPVREKSHFRISGPDNVCTVVLPRLCRQYANGP